MTAPITEFRGEHHYLSNFFPSAIVHTLTDGRKMRFSNAEAAFQAEKALPRAHEFCDLSPSDAKRLGRQVILRADWDDVREDIMRRVVHEKFAQHPDLAQKLIATGDACLIEGNTWNDRTWGAVYDMHRERYVGQNKLGEILMDVRDALST